jgi:O-Antigen ligase
MRARLPPVLAVPLLLGPGVLACFAGGYFDQPRLVSAIVAWAALAAVAVVAPTPLPAGGSARVGLAGLAALTAWTGLSLLWAPLGGPAADDLQRLLLYVAALAVGIYALADPRVRPWAEPLLLAAVLGAILYGLSERLALTTFTPVLSAGDRLAHPLTYWNATGAFAALGLVLAAGLAGEPERPRRLRMAAAAAAAPLGLAVYLTFSRGALGALAAGLMLLLALRPTAAQLRAAAICVAAAVLAAAASEALPSVQRTRDHSAAQGAAMAAVLTALMAVGALAARSEAGPRTLPRLRTAALGVLALAVVGSVVAVARVERSSGADTPAASAARLPSLQSNRYAYWRVALKTFAADPLHGIGSGSFRVAWLQRRRFAEPVRDAHSLELETAAELGIVGLACLAAFLGGIAAGAVRAGPAAATATAALAVWAFHSAIDWDWELPGFSLVALALAALLLSAPAAAPSRAPAVERDAPVPAARG